MLILKSLKYLEDFEWVILGDQTFCSSFKNYTEKFVGHSSGSDGDRYDFTNPKDPYGPRKSRRTET